MAIVGRLGAAAAALSIALALLIGAVRLLAYDEAAIAQVRALLTSSEACASPCFLGIRPGHTPTRQVPELLQAHPWVQEMETRRVQNEYDTITLHWSGSQPDFIREAGRVNLWHGAVDWIAVQPEITLAEIWLAFGVPATSRVDRYNITLHYPAHGFYVRLATHCRELWSQQPAIYITRPAAGGEAYHYPGLFRQACGYR